jgi:hypothetical protein
MLGVALGNLLVRFHETRLGYETNRARRDLPDRPRALAAKSASFSHALGSADGYALLVRLGISIIGEKRWRKLILDTGIVE